MNFIKNMNLITKIVIGIVIVLILIVFAFYYEQKVAVLGYHTFATKEFIDQMEVKDIFVMDINKFEEQLKYLKKHNYKTLTLDEFYCFKEGKCKIPRKSVLITMDDGYQSNYDLAFPLLKKYHMNATVFCIGYRVQNNIPNYMNQDILKKTKKEYPNITFASHSYDLHHENDIEKEKEFLEEDFVKMKEIINTKYFAYPYGQDSVQAREVLQENDYKLAFGFGPGKEHRKARRKDDNYKVPRLNISNDMPLWKFKLRLLMPF